MYAVFKLLHILGVVILVGNVTVTAVWKVFADRTRDSGVVRFAQTLVTYTDWTLTLGGATLVALGGYGMLMNAKIALGASRWLVIGQGMFVLSGLIWVAILIPIQRQQSKLVAAFGASGTQVSDVYWKLGRRWILWGVIGTIPLVIALGVMVMKL